MNEVGEREQEWSIYVLALEDGKYYVGKSKKVNKRFGEHSDKKGSAWTRKHKPIGSEPIEVVPMNDPFDEDKVTIKYMEKYGIDNVRGGSFCQVILPESSYTTINTIINSSTDKCFKCGEKGHFVRNCPSTLKDIRCFKCGSKGHYSYNCPNKIKCFKCGRFDGHYASECPETDSETSSVSDSSEFSSNEESDDYCQIS